MQKKISIILPVFNEQDSLPIVYRALVDVMATMPHYDYELIFVNDGSYDASWLVIKQLAQSDKRIRAISFSRNFGHQVALKAGYDIAFGDAVITLDADMQHPPSMLSAMLDAWQHGVEIVYVRRVNRSTDGLCKRITAKLYYVLLDAITDVKIPRDVADFRLLDKKVVAIIKGDTQISPFWRGMVAWTGFSCTILECNYASRAGGKTGYTWRKMIRLACDGITGFSLFPLKIAAYVGIFVVISGVAMFAYITIDALFHAVHYPLFKWLVTVIYIFMGVQFLLLWLLGEYIGRMYEQQKQRPVYIVRESLNLGKQDEYAQ